MRELLGQVDAVVVVGGRNSNNTRQLVALCQRSGKPTMHVETAKELSSGFFKGVATVGLTAGTSTLNETIDEVHRRLEEIGPPDENREDTTTLLKVDKHTFI